MAQQDPSAQERTATALALLKPVAQEVNAAAAELSKPIAAVENTLKLMNIAFEAWVTYRATGDKEQGEYTDWDLGFSRVHGHWGICIRVYDGNAVAPDRDRSEEWHFNESPIYLRQRAVDALPELIEALAKTGAAVARKLNSAKERAAAIAEAAAPKARK